jgi:antitoxin HicB
MVRSTRKAGIVSLPTLSALKVLLYKSLRSEGVTRAELARRLGWHREQVDRLFRLDHASRLDQLEAAYRAVNQNIEISITPRPSARVQA